MNKKIIEKCVYKKIVFGLLLNILIGTFIVMASNSHNPVIPSSDTELEFDLAIEFFH